MKPCFLRLACLLGLICLTSRAIADEPADLILHHGKVVTVNDKFEVAQALAIRDGKIIAVGKDEDVLKLRGDKTEVVDLGGKTVLPGLIDSHTHPTGAAMHE